MSLNHRQQRELQRIESRLFQSEPHLAAMLTVFGRLSADQRMPAREQVATRMDRMRQAAVLITKAIAGMAAAIAGMAAAIAGMAAAIDLLISAVMALLTALIMGSRARPPQPTHQQTVPGTNGR